MKTLSAREYLGQLEFLDTSINQDLERLNDMRINACSTGGIDYSDERVQTSPSGDSLCRQVTNYVAFDDEINAEIDRFVDAKNLIIKQIRGLHNNYFNPILFKVYVQFKTLKVASGEMGMSYQYVRNLHSAALTRFEEIYDDLHYLT